MAVATMKQITCRAALIETADAEWQAHKSNKAMISDRRTWISGALIAAGAEPLSPEETLPDAAALRAASAVIAKADGEFQAHKESLSRITSRFAYISGQLIAAGFPRLSPEEEASLKSR